MTYLLLYSLTFLSQRIGNLLAAVLGDGALKAWHEGWDKMAPDVHLDWLIKQGFSEKEALQLKWLSKDMNEHDSYMQDFLKVFATLEYWGPGSEADTKKALSHIPKAPGSILEVGCGKGLATKVLAENSEAKITAVDNEQAALDRLSDRFEQQGISDRLTTVNASMTELPFSRESFDLIWSEGSAYIMGVEQALAKWKPLLRKEGYLLISDMVWRTDVQSRESIEFWAHEYPDMQLVSTRIEQMKRAGYLVVENFPMSEAAWLNYYSPLDARVGELECEMPASAALKDIKNEVRVCTQFSHEFGYHMFILAKE